MRSFAELILLSALWGASFLFLRVLSPVLGPVLLIELRVLIAFLFLMPILLSRGRFQDLRRHWLLIACLSLGTMCLPFTLIAYATLSISAGMASILNATVPFFAALSGLLIWRQRLSIAGLCGLILGFGGVFVLIAGSDDGLGDTGRLLAVLAGLGASLLYGVSANVIARHLTGVSGLEITVGSLFFSGLGLAPFAFQSPPLQIPTIGIWISLVGLSVFCTAFAYLLYYRLIARIGAYQTVTVTFLVPVFSVVWAWLFLGERLTLGMGIGSVLVLAGVAIATGRLPMPAWPRVGKATQSGFDPGSRFRG